MRTNHIAEWSEKAEAISGVAEQPSKTHLLTRHSFDTRSLLAFSSILGRVVDHPAHGRITKIQSDPSVTDSAAMTSAEHPPHTDGSFTDAPSIIILHFCRTDPAAGGASTLYSIPELLADMPARYLELLESEPVEFRRQVGAEGECAFTGTILYRDDQGHMRLRWRNDSYVSPEPPTHASAEVKAAIAYVADYFRDTPPILYQAKPGDTLIIPQRFFLHGRTALSGAQSPRLAYRVWLK